MNAAPLWLPQSACGTGCLPPNRSGQRWAVASRLVAVAAVLVGAVLLAPVLAAGDARLRRRLLRRLARAVLHLLGVRLTVRGRLPRAGSLLVANHVSWLDIIVLLAACPARMVAKREVRDWPVVGVLAGLAGTIFVDRSRPRTLPGTVAAVATALRAGASVAVFPEGTTSCGAGSGPFRPAMFQAAVDAGAPVVPLAIGYDSTAAAFVGDDALLTSVWRVAATRGMAASLTMTPPVHPGGGAGRRPLARVATAAIGPAGGRARVTAHSELSAFLHPEPSG